MTRPSCIALFLAATVAACGDGSAPPDGPDAGTGGDHSWREVRDAEGDGWLLSAWGPSADNVYIVGGTPETGRILRYDGADFEIVDTATAVPLVNWAYGFGPDDVTFVGNQGTILHYDGTRFEVQATPTEQDLWGVWGSAPNDLWAVGGNGDETGLATLLHFDGSDWTATATPTLNRANVRAFFKVWGTSAEQVFVVGQRGVLLAYDGTTWTAEESGTGEDLVSLWGTAPDNILAVGGRQNGVVAHYDGDGWTSRVLDFVPGLNGVWMRRADIAHVGGVGGTIGTVSIDDLSFTSSNQSLSGLTIHAMFGDDSGHLWAAGGSLSDPRPPQRGLLLGRPLRDDE